MNRAFFPIDLSILGLRRQDLHGLLFVKLEHASWNLDVLPDSGVLGDELLGKSEHSPRMLSRFPDLLLVRVFKALAWVGLRSMATHGLRGRESLAIQAQIADPLPLAGELMGSHCSRGLSALANALATCLGLFGHFIFFGSTLLNLFLCGRRGQYRFPLRFLFLSGILNLGF